MIARLKALNDRPRLVALLMAFAALVLFAVHLDRPGKLMFDEVHYVPAARALLTLDGSEAEELAWEASPFVLEQPASRPHSRAALTRSERMRF